MKDMNYIMIHETVTYWYQLCEQDMLLLHRSVLNQRDRLYKNTGMQKTTRYKNRKTLPLLPRTGIMHASSISYSSLTYIFLFAEPA